MFDKEMYLLVNTAKKFLDRDEIETLLNELSEEAWKNKMMAETREAYEVWCELEEKYDLMAYYFARRKENQIHE